MAKIPTLSQNSEELERFRGILTAKESATGFRVAFNSGKVSRRKRRANRANSPGGILKLLNEQIRDDDLQGWKDFAESIGVRWSVASIFIAGSLKRNGYANIGEIRNGLLRLGGATGVSQAPAPDGFFNTYLRIVKPSGGIFRLEHFHPQSFVVRNQDDQLKQVFRNREFVMGDLTQLKATIDFRQQNQSSICFFDLRAYLTDDCTGTYFQATTPMAANGRYTAEIGVSGDNYRSFSVAIINNQSDLWYEIDNLSVRHGGIELMIDPGLEYYERNKRGIFRAQLPQFDESNLASDVKITTHFENNYI